MCSLIIPHRTTPYNHTTASKKEKKILKLFSDRDINFFRFIFGCALHIITECTANVTIITKNEKKRGKKWNKLSWHKIIFLTPLFFDEMKKKNYCHSNCSTRNYICLELHAVFWVPEYSWKFDQGIGHVAIVTVTATAIQAMRLHYVEKFEIKCEQKRYFVTMLIAISVRLCTAIHKMYHNRALCFSFAVRVMQSCSHVGEFCNCVIYVRRFKRSITSKLHIMNAIQWFSAKFRIQ